MIHGFDSLREYTSFAMARGFFDTRDNVPLEYKKTRIEHCGDFLVRPVLGGLDRSVQRLDSTYVIAGLAVTAIAAAVVFYYPHKIVLPFKFLTGGRVKLALYCALMTTLAGIGLRTIGRLDPNGELMPLWRQRDNGERILQPLPLGAVVR